MTQERTSFTEAAFDSIVWHDDHIHGLAIRDGGVLRFDLDHIVEWFCGADRTCRFRVAPATLEFRGVTGLHIEVDWEDPKYRTAVHPISVGSLARTPHPGPPAGRGGPCWRWRFGVNWPSGSITFGASGFDLRLRGPPVLSESQCLSPTERLGPPGPFMGRKRPAT